MLRCCSPAGMPAACCLPPAACLHPGKHSAAHLAAEGVAAEGRQPLVDRRRAQRRSGKLARRLHHRLVLAVARRDAPAAPRVNVPGDGANVGQELVKLAPATGVGGCMICMLRLEACMPRCAVVIAAAVSPSASLELNTPWLPSPHLPVVNANHAHVLLHPRHAQQATQRAHRRHARPRLARKAVALHPAPAAREAAAPVLLLPDRVGGRGRAGGVVRSRHCRAVQKPQGKARRPSASHAAVRRAQGEVARGVGSAVRLQHREQPAACWRTYGSLTPSASAPHAPLLPPIYQSLHSPLTHNIVGRISELVPLAAPLNPSAGQPVCHHNLTNSRGWCSAGLATAWKRAV